MDNVSKAFIENLTKHKMAKDKIDEFVWPHTGQFVEVFRLKVKHIVDLYLHKDIMLNVKLIQKCCLIDSKELSADEALELDAGLASRVLDKISESLEY